MFILGNQFLLPADKAENGDLAVEGGLWCILISPCVPVLALSVHSRVSCDDQVVSVGSQPCSTIVTPI